MYHKFSAIYSDVLRRIARTTCPECFFLLSLTAAAGKVLVKRRRRLLASGGGGGDDDDDDDGSGGVEVSVEDFDLQELMGLLDDLSRLV